MYAIFHATAVEANSGDSLADPGGMEKGQPKEERGHKIKSFTERQTIDVNSKIKEAFT